jgi:hypothetical protein
MRVRYNANNKQEAERLTVEDTTTKEARGSEQQQQQQTQLLLCRLWDVVVGVDFLVWLQLFFQQKILMDRLRTRVGTFFGAIFLDLKKIDQKDRLKMNVGLISAYLNSMRSFYDLVQMTKSWSAW